jgi:hypothetical protein
VVVDLGAGDGRAVLRRARREPRTLFIGIDAVADALREASRRAARRSDRGGLPNVILLVGAAETLPWLLAGRVDELVVALPWGSLLEGVMAPHSGLAARLLSMLRPGGRLELLLSLEGADAATGLPPLDEDAIAEVAGQYAGLGMRCCGLREATAQDVARLSGSWGRRLGIPQRRRAYLLSLSLGA